VSGAAENRRIEELIPGILSQLGPESMDYLRSYADMMKAAAGGAAGGMDAVEEGEEEDDEVPDLVENFEEAAAK
jgi:nascent polypeptide-associated complex subunit beta